MRRTKSIEQVRVGDSVLAFDLESGRIVPQRVVETYRRLSRHIRILQIRSPGDEVQELRTTDEHPFWVPGKGWITAGRLSVGERLLQSDGTIATLGLTRRDECPEGIPVYNFQVEELHNYFVAQRPESHGFLLVHNDCWMEAYNRFVRNGQQGQIWGLQNADPTRPTGYNGVVSHHYVYENPNGMMYDVYNSQGVPRAQWLAKYMADINAQTDAAFEKLIQLFRVPLPYGQTPPDGFPR